MAKHFIKAIFVKKAPFVLCMTLLCAGLMILSVTPKKANIAFAETKGPSVELTTDPSGNVVAVDENIPANEDLQAPSKFEKDRSVQVILTDAKSAVISGPMDGVLNKLPFESGDKFKKGDILAEYECRLERAKVDEIRARMRLSDRQFKAYNRLKAMDAVAEIEYLSVDAANKQEKALFRQAEARASLCSVKAPFDGRVKEKIASNYEAVKSGRVLMEISQSAPLHAELLIPSVWLQWLNTGSPMEIYIHESDKKYNAKVIRIHGQVDPITQTAHVVAKIDGYKEELLPGMSGRALFLRPKDTKEKRTGFLGFTLGEE